MLYKNGINVELSDLMDIKIIHEKETIGKIEYTGIGNLIPIGGGKDSNVTLELMKSEFDINTCFVINPKDVNIKCCETAEYDDDKICTIKRVLDTFK